MGAQSAAEADHKQKEQESAQLQGGVDQNKRTIVEIEIGLKKFLSKKRKRDAAPAKGGKGLMERYASLPFEEEEDVQDDNNENEDNNNSTMNETNALAALILPKIGTVTANRLNASTATIQPR